DILKTKAQDLVELMKINDFKGSDGWLSCFKNRHHIYSVTRQGESAPAPIELLPQYCEELQTLAHGEISGTKQSKARVSIMLACNSKGEKLKPLLIHKYENPHAIRGMDKAELPVYYFSKFNEQMKKVKKKIIMLLDNASSHVGDLNMSNVKLHFFPINTTAHLQPLDVGITWLFKCHYKKLLCQNRVEMYDLYKLTRNKECILGEC
ncbi:7178_t:CDS:2, partial [Entrophospora sp. SA101]